MNKIDLSKYEIRTDMICDLVENKSEKEYKINNVKVSHIMLDDNNEIGKKKGTYVTLEFDDVTDSDSKQNVSEVFKDELLKVLEKEGYNENLKTMVVGLGNINSTPDSLGPKVIEKIIVTNHLFNMNIKVDNKLSCVSAFYPGVTGSTGIETSEYINGVINVVKPDFVIVIDALASSSITRVNKSIQISTAGITPGSGVGNKRKEISKDTLGIPVVAVGIPTVVDATVIVSDTINYMFKNYAYHKNNDTKKISKLMVKPINYLKSDINSSVDDRKKLFGLVGLLNDDELKQLLNEVLTPIGYNLMVTPKEVDFLIEKLSDVISYGINHSLHKI